MFNFLFNQIHKVKDAQQPSRLQVTSRSNVYRMRKIRQPGMMCRIVPTLAQCLPVGVHRLETIFNRLCLPVHHPKKFGDFQEVAIAQGQSGSKEAMVGQRVLLAECQRARQGHYSPVSP